MGHYGDVQNEMIYNAGLSRALPAFPGDFATLERRAESAMTPSLLNYVQGRCGDKHTQRARSRRLSP